ncbi:uncharacterized protein LOC119344014 [Triticum dicoccoides]|uniref:uncharacterized protein LOC119342813 n=1 Tax=Triticum dicoccoides TaxID=85692 RepID=UPI0003D54B75|nr:uncharacterized protein LOC119342813 [Triticum dicoccoides]XP_037470571.1 uncharacterized protein LOC119344014 [Triticum dicoccoides]
MAAAGNLPHPSPATLLNAVLDESASLDDRNAQWTEEAARELRNIAVAVRANAQARNVAGARAELTSTVQHLTPLLCHFMSEGVQMRKLRRMFRTAVGAPMVPAAAPDLPPFFRVGDQCMSQAEISNGILRNTSESMSGRVNAALTLLGVVEAGATNPDEVWGTVNEHLEEVTTYTEMMVAQHTALVLHMRCVVMSIAAGVRLYVPA